MTPLEVVPTIPLFLRMSMERNIMFAIGNHTSDALTAFKGPIFGKVLLKNAVTHGKTCSAIRI